MILPEYRKAKRIHTITTIEPYGRLLGATMIDGVPDFHFDPDPLYRETTFSQGWDPEKDVPPSVREYVKMQREGKEWLKKQNRVR
jgi:hypothetical protein